MASPVAHSLAAVALGKLLRPASARSTAGWYGFAVLSACAADLDFAIDWFFPGGTTWHHGPTHSLTAALVWGAAAALLLGSWWGPRGRLFLAATILYGSHLAIDLLCGQASADRGQLLLWPVSQVPFHSSFRPLSGILHGREGDSLATIFGELVSWHNLRAVAQEIAVFLPPMLLVLWLSRSAPPDSRAASPWLDGSLEARVARLEAHTGQLRRTALAGLVIVWLSGLLGWAASSRQESLYAERVVLVDPYGQRRILLDVTRDGRPYLIFYDATGEERTALGVDERGFGVLAFLGADEKARATLTMSDEGLPQLIFRDLARNMRATLVVRDDGQPAFAVFDESSRKRGEVSVDAQGRATWTAFDGAGRPLDEVPLEQAFGGRAR